MNVGVLGSVGLALLVYTVVSMMQKIEESFNSIWRNHPDAQYGRALQSLPERAAGRTAVDVFSAWHHGDGVEFRCGSGDSVGRGRWAPCFWLPAAWRRTCW